MSWQPILPRQGVRSSSGGVTCAWRIRQRRLAVTLSAEVCRRLGMKSGVKEHVAALVDQQQGLLRLRIGARDGGWMPRPKDGCMSVLLPLDGIAASLPQKPAQSVPYEVDEAERSVTLTLPPWAAPGAAAARDAAARVRRAA